jgi:endonuclease/exonuclease/phosphatase family metal-dependent hydrolase
MSRLPTSLRIFRAASCLVAFLVLLTSAARAQPVTLRVATFNIEDVRTEDLRHADHPRLRRIAEVIQRIRPNIILLNEIAYDMPGAPGFDDAHPPGQNAQRFADLYLAVPQAADVQALRLKAWMPPVNTGIPSGFDLDKDGSITTAFPPPGVPGPDGSPPPQSAEGRAYGNDCWGFGTFPGQYGMAILVDERLTIAHDAIRTFQRLPWSYVSGAFLPQKPDGSPWYTEEELRYVRLSSKTFADVPVSLPNGTTLHLLCSHPTPPAFDGPEMRNQKRNHDEIRLIADYIDNASYLVDDNNTEGGLSFNASFIILGDLNADPAKGNSFKNPINLYFFSSPRVAKDVAPRSDIQIPGMDPTDTAAFKLRVDYVLPSADLTILASGLWRTNPAGGASFPSDHFPVWMDVKIPGAAQP